MITVVHCFIFPGLETMHLLTQRKNYELKVDMEDFEGQKVFAHYSSFSVGPESDGYKLNLGSFIKGAAGGTFCSLFYKNFFFFTLSTHNLSTKLGFFSS